MGFSFATTKTSNTAKLINKYLKERVKEKQLFNNQIERLDKQLQDETIDEYTYERLKDVLEINFIKQRDEILEKAIIKKC
jgi:hypothetical protein